MTELDKIYKIYLKCNQNICTDSRSKKIKKSIFFGIKGENFDGNMFINDALSKGAQFAISDNKKYLNRNNIIYVKDSLKTLQELAKIHRKKISIPIIAITGTNGKTTTKDLIHHVLKSTFSTYSTKGNFNNHIGVPLSILSIKNTHQFGIIELGANHKGEIKFLCSLARPTHGIITNIGKAHLEGFGSFENIISTKSELYSYLKQNNGIVFVNSNDKLLLKLLNNYKHIEKYCVKESDYQKTKLSNTLYFTCNPFINILLENKEIQTKIIGNYNTPNIAAAIKIAKFFKVKDSIIYNALKDFELKNNRSQLIQTKKNTIILDAYNANPTSTTHAINNFIKIKKETHPNQLIILGDMLELGDKEIKYHQEIVNLLEKSNIKTCLLIGNIFSKTICNENYLKISSTRECAKILIEKNIKNTTILIKGSRKMQLETIIELL